jgi:hypothetical protein
MNLLDVVAPFAAIAILAIAVIAVYVRQGRNRVLEEMIESGEVGSIASFRGTLAIQENRPGFLRLIKDSKAGRLQFLYRWIIGMGPQAAVDDVTFDGSQQGIELTRNNKQKNVPFAEFSAIRMREVAATTGRRFGGLLSLWHVELVLINGSRLLILSSERGNRQRAFEQTAAIAKAASEIMSILVQVVVDGKVWTPGWPPKRRPSLS